MRHPLLPLCGLPDGVQRQLHNRNPGPDFATPEEARRECSRLNEEARKNWEE